jgi:two-component system cell cycle sensor histidine kinase/response regulator CckA
MKSNGKTILLVDSDRIHRERNVRVLRASGFRVLEAREYQDADNMWQRHRDEIALLVTAMVLPDRNGFDLAERLRSADSKLKVLFTSGATGAVISEFHTREGEATNTLFRPFGAGELVRKVIEVLRNRQTSAAGS